MNLMLRLAALFYVTFLLFVGVLIILFGLNLMPYSAVRDLFYIIYYDPQVSMTVVGIGAGILVLNFFFWRSLTADSLRDKTIAFDNPSGRVNVSLKALEDLIRREVARVPEVKEVRPSLKAGKNGLVIDARVVLNADVNIPEMTSFLQDRVKSKIHDTMGVEEKVIVHIDVIKIIPGKSKSRRRNEEETEKPRKPNVPFQGYRA